MPMRRAQDGRGMGQAVRAHLYRTAVPKESRKSRERVRSGGAALTATREDVSRVCGHPSPGIDPHAVQEHTMSPPTRDTTHHTKAKRRRYHTAQERLARDRRQAQHAAKVLEQALHDLGLAVDVVADLVEG